LDSELITAYNRKFLPDKRAVQTQLQDVTALADEVVATMIANYHKKR
jgi:hypothetical protein